VGRRQNLFPFRSQRGPITLFVYENRARTKVTQVIANRGLDMEVGDGLVPMGIVYEQFGSIHVYDYRLAQRA